MDDPPGRRAAPESVDDVLARHGLIGGAPTTGRAARRRAAEAAEAAELAAAAAEIVAVARSRQRDLDESTRRAHPDSHAQAGSGPVRTSTDRPLADRRPRAASEPSAPPRGRPGPTDAPRRRRRATELPDLHSGALERTQAVRPGWVTASDTARGLKARTARASEGEPVDTQPRGERLRACSATDPETGATTRIALPTPATSAGRGVDTDADASEAKRIDETLTRMTAAHAGLRLVTDPAPVEPPRRRLFTPGRLVCLAVALLVLGATTVGWAARAWLGNAVPAAGALDLASASIVDAPAQKGATNVLVVAQEHELVPGAGDTGGHNPDTITLAHVAPDGGPLTVLTLPPDLEINRPPCERYDPITHSYTTTTPAEARTQLVSALSVGGPRCLTRVVQQLTGIAVTGYAGVDLDRLATLADTVGGARVCVPRPVLDGALGPVVPDAGEQELRGPKVTDFLRADQVQGEYGTQNGQVERQQSVVAAVLGPLLSTTGLLNVAGLAAARPGLGEALTTDGLDLDQVLATARSLHDLDAEGVVQVTAPTTSAPNGRGNLALHDTEASAVFAALRTSGPLPPAATAAGAATTPQPSELKVKILNASDRTGLATQVHDTLGKLGFGVGEVGNAAQRGPQTSIRFSPDQEANAGLLGSTVPSATLVPAPGTSGVLELQIGSSFDQVLRPPTAPPAEQATGDAPNRCT